MSEKHKHKESSSEGGRLNLRADCERCFALCCVAPTFSISADFPITKAEVRHKKKDLRGADLIGAHLKEADLRGANLRGAYLIGADLRGADLTDSLFLIQSQLDAAKGDGDTKLSPSLTRPKHYEV